MRELSPVILCEGGIELAVRVTPRASRAAVEGLVTDAAGTAWLAVKVTAPPDAGRANAAVLSLLAKVLGIAPSSVTIRSGTMARWKRIAIMGDAPLLARRVMALVEAEPGWPAST